MTTPPPVLDLLGRIAGTAVLYAAALIITIHEFLERRRA